MVIKAFALMGLASKGDARGLLLRLADSFGETPLMRAAALSSHRGSEECVRVLLPFSDANAQNAVGRTALMMALARGWRGAGRLGAWRGTGGCSWRSDGLPWIVKDNKGADARKVPAG